MGDMPEHEAAHGRVNQGSDRLDVVAVSLAEGLGSGSLLVL